MCILDREWRPSDSPHLIRLIDDQVLIKLIQPKNQTASGLLWIPPQAKRPDYEMWNGRVIAVGPGERAVVPQRPNEVAQPTKLFRESRKPMDVKVGDKVLFYWTAGRVPLAKWPDENHIIIPESMIQLVWND